MNRVADAGMAATGCFDRQPASPVLEHEWLANLVYQMTDAVLLEYQGKIVFANPAALRLYDAVTADALASCSLAELTIQEERDAVSLSVTALSQPGVSRQVEERARTLTGRVVPVEVTRMLVPLCGGRAVCMVARDITDRYGMIGRLRHDAAHDALTGLANRRRFTERLESATATRRKDRHLALVFIDLDRFKDINDQYGHRTGDLVLKSVADTLTACVRGTDLVARLGGDEFVLLLSDYVSETEIRRVLRRILDCVSCPRTILDQELAVSCSIGYSLYPCGSTLPERFLSFSDTAMYRAKQAGGNCIRRSGHDSRDRQTGNRLL